MYDRQLELEFESVNIGIKEYQTILRKKRQAKDGVESMKPETAMINAYMMPFLSGVKGPTKKESIIGLRKFIRIGQGRTGGGVMIRRLIKDQNPLEIAYITLRTLFNSIHEAELKYFNLAYRLGRAVQDHVGYKRFKENDSDRLRNLENYVRMSGGSHKRKAIKNVANRSEATAFQAWSKNECFHVGNKLLDILCHTTGIAQRVELPDEVGIHKRSNESYYLIVNGDLLQKLDEAHGYHEANRPFHFPMIIPPMDWTTMTNGGHIGQKAVSRYSLVGQNRKAGTNDSRVKNFEPIQKAINKLQAVPWKINGRILEVIKWIRDGQFSLGAIPPLNKDELFKDFVVKSREEMDKLKATSEEAFIKEKRQLKIRHDNWARNVSKRSGFLKQIMIAEKFLNEDAIWFCYTAEWRGRINCVQSHVSPQANDVGKGLLLFKNGMPLLTDIAVEWFMIHGAGCYADQTSEIDNTVDKLSFQERIDWVLRHEAEIIASANDPFNAEFWTKADKPITFLAWCFEYSDWVASGKSLDFVTNIPVALDGSCSGLQHMSAMMADKVCAQFVNLTKSHSPEDVYRKVAEALEPVVITDAKQGNKFAKMWQHQCNRGTTKSAVMTFVYGAKDRTYTKQLMDLLQKHEDKGKNYINTLDENPWEACQYMKDRIVEAMSEVIKSGVDFMDWTQELAGIFADLNLPIKWTTPDGVEIVQSYRRMEEKRINTYWGNTVFRPVSRVASETVSDKRGMKNGLSPNFVHSYDACHLRTVINEFDHDITVIHDSFGALPQVAGELHVTLRRTFKEMYETDQIDRFINEIRDQLWPGVELPIRPHRGNWSPEAMDEALYSFS